MPRYVFLSFLFMGWAFYELSGGADFKPAPRPAVTAQATPEPARPEPPITPAITAALTPQPVRPQRPQGREALVTAASVTEGAVYRRAQAEANIAEIRATLQQGLPVFPDTQPRESVQVASLADLAATPPSDEPDLPEVTAVRPAPVAEADLREVVATRVNMRAGPSLDDDIIDRLERGHQVEILENNGKGWLRLRSLPDDRVGWIAERLVSAAN
ncbi:SH3 domain-containing protein [Pseudooceanicola sp.]|uniref:SH3 domain-containing protein n=1 Tax=Pseudooceanicola sp. TaxID=1914328 RepID=UPI003517C85F